MDPRQQSTVAKYLSDHVAAIRHAKDAMERQHGASFMNDDAAARDAVSETHGALTRHINELERRLNELDAGGTWKEAVTAVTGFLAGTYDRLRTERLARALRDDYTALCLLNISQMMMLTTAGACGDTGTAELVRQQQRELPLLIMKIAERIPAAVLLDLERDDVPLVNRDIPEISVRALRSSWQHASI